MGKMQEKAKFPGGGEGVYAEKLLHNSEWSCCALSGGQEHKSGGEEEP